MKHLIVLIGLIFNLNAFSQETLLECESLENDAFVKIVKTKVSEEESKLTSVFSVKDDSLEPVTLDCETNNTPTVYKEDQLRVSIACYSEQFSAYKMTVYKIDGSPVQFALYNFGYAPIMMSCRPQ